MTIPHAQRLFALAACGAAVVHASYPLSDAGGGTIPFDGVGAISGGGATSRLLYSYRNATACPKTCLLPDVRARPASCDCDSSDTLSQILDFLFTPNFGASFHIFKVEIGGGALSTEGSEASHMRTPDDVDPSRFLRGYEYPLMREALNRNPNILLYGLPWTWPGWVGAGTGNPWGNITAAAVYIREWLQGASSVWNASVGVVGTWNERPYSPDYVKQLRATLDAANLSSVRILCDDGRYYCVPDMLKDPSLAAAVSLVGGHGPAPSQAAATGKAVWFSEDFHAHGNEAGGGTWATQINRRFIMYNMTATIAWNAIDAFYAGLAFDNTGLMTANSPWSGNYQVLAPIWATAHTTQFTLPGYRYLPVNSGSGMLALGGSYVTYVSYASGTTNWTLVVEKFSNAGDPVTQAENATFVLGGTLARAGTVLYMWRSAFALQPGETSDYFRFMGSFTLDSSFSFTVAMDVDTVVTVTTSPSGKKGTHPTPPPATPFPTQYASDFNSCNPPDEVPYWHDVSGTWECVNDNSTHGIIMRLITPDKPCVWEKDLLPHALFGDMNWADVNATIDIRIPSAAQALFGLRVTLLNVTDYSGLMNEESMPGLWMVITPSAAPGSNGNVVVFASILNITTGYAPLLNTSLPVLVQQGEWHTYTLVTSGNAMSAWVDGQPIFQAADVHAYPYTGWVGFGAGNYGQAVDWDNLIVDAS